MASKALSCGNPTISADGWSWRRLWLRCPAVGPNRIADHRPTAFLLVIAFPPPIACLRHGADPGRHVCRNSIAYYPWPLMYLRPLSLIVTNPKQVVKAAASVFFLTSATGGLGNGFCKAAVNCSANTQHRLNCGISAAV